MRTPHGPAEERLNGRDRCICIAHLRKRVSVVSTASLENDTCAQAMTPDLSTISGLTPKFSGFQSTRSAKVPTAIWPTKCEIPCVIALRMYILAMCTNESNKCLRVDRVLRDVSFDACVIVALSIP